MRLIQGLSREANVPDRRNDRTFHQAKTPKHLGVEIAIPLGSKRSPSNEYYEMGFSISLQRFPAIESLSDMRSRNLMDPSETGL